MEKRWMMMMEVNVMRRKGVCNKSRFGEVLARAWWSKLAWYTSNKTTSDIKNPLHTYTKPKGCQRLVTFSEAASPSRSSNDSRCGSHVQCGQSAVIGSGYGSSKLAKA